MKNKIKIKIKVYTKNLREENKNEKNN